MKAIFNTLILYVRDVDLLKRFYSENFELVVLEEDEQWVLLHTEGAHIGLHKMGALYADNTLANERFKQNAKLVFEIDADIESVRNAFVSKNIEMRAVKTFDNYDFWLCDGLDPEGNVFQLKSRKL